MNRVLWSLLLVVQAAGLLVIRQSIDRNAHAQLDEHLGLAARVWQRLLDQRALAIVRAASPFGAFTAAMRANADQLVVTSRFRFTREDGLETTLSGR